MGQNLLTHIMAADLAAGVRQRIAGSVSNTRFTILHCDLLSPPWDPTHCSPGVTWVLRYDDTRHGSPTSACTTRALPSQPRPSTSQSRRR